MEPIAQTLTALADEWTALAADQNRISVIWRTSDHPDRELLAGVARGRARQLTDCAIALRRALSELADAVPANGRQP